MNQKNFLSRKQLRKQQREEKKAKKDLFYKNRFNNGNKKNLKPVSQAQQNKVSSINEKFPKNKKIKEINDEEIESEEEEKPVEFSDEEIVEDDEDQEIFEDDGENEYNENPGQDQNDTELAKLDKELRMLEKKLGIKNEKKKQLFKKRLTQENYDHDFLDFLDHIDNVVHEEKKTKNKISETENITAKTKNSKKLKNIHQEKIDNLDDVKNNEENEKTDLSEIKKKSKLFKNVDKETEQKLEFNKQLIGLLNKTSEGNIAIIFDEYNKLIDTYKGKIKDITFFYEKITNITIKLILEQDIININITGCICAFVSILHFKLGNNFFLYFLNKIVSNFFNALDFVHKNKNESWDFTHNKNIVKNFVFIIIHFYIFGNLTSKFYFDIIKLFIDQLNDITSEMLLILLRHVGIEIRKENAEIIKEIVSLVNVKYNSLVAEEKLNLMNSEKPAFENKKLKFIVEMIEDIKNNKFLKFNLLEKFSFLKTFVANNSKLFENNLKTESYKLDVGIDQIKKFDINSKTDIFQNDNENKKNENEVIVDDELIDDANIINTEKLQKMFKKYKINTDLKKKIFTAIVTGADYLDTFEKLMRLNLSSEQSRDIIKIIVLLINNEKCFNQFYFILLKKLISFNKDHKYTFHFTIWDQLKIMEGLELKSIHSLAKTTALLLNEEVIGLPCLLNVDFDNANEKQFLFVLLVFDKYFEKTNVDKTKILFAKLVKNDNHVEFAKKLFAYLVKTFLQDIELKTKSEAYNENYNAAVRILKKVL